MSYSFRVQAATKAEAIAKVEAEMEKVVASQPIHAEDDSHAIAAATAFVGILADDATKDVAVRVAGSLSTADGSVRGADVSVAASLVDKA